VAKVATLKKSHPIIADRILDAIDNVTLSAHNLITSEDFDPEDDDSLKHLGELITVNHGLLVALGVSHPRLERIRELIDHAGIGWTKLTGAGGGGCAITIMKPPSMLPPPIAPIKRARSKSTVLRDLEQQLDNEGFEKYTVTLAGDGVGVLWPAVLQNGNGEVGGEEIDQAKFLQAQGNAGIEQLVGVREIEGELVRQGWKFWRC
jgi:mevalonate kinase